MLFLLVASNKEVDLHLETICTKKYMSSNHINLGFQEGQIDNLHFWTFFFLFDPDWSKRSICARLLEGLSLNYIMPT